MMDTPDDHTPPPGGPPPGQVPPPPPPAGPPAGPEPPLVVPSPGPADSLLNASLHDGWETFKREPGMLIGLFLLYLVVTALLFAILGGAMALDGVFEHEDGRFFFWLQVYQFLTGIFSIGLLYASLHAVRRQPISFSLFISGFRNLLPVAIGLVLVHLVVGFGLLFLIVPGIILALGFSQWALLVMDGRMNAPQALSRSWVLMRGYKAEYFLLWLVLIAINIAGLIPLGFGLIVTIPLTFAVQAAFYDRLVRARPAALARATS